MWGRGSNIWRYFYSYDHLSVLEWAEAAKYFACYRDHNISIMFVLARRMPGGARLWTIFSPLYPSVKGNMLPEMAHTATAAAATSV